MSTKEKKLISHSFGREIDYTDIVRPKLSLIRWFTLEYKNKFENVQWLVVSPLLPTALVEQHE